MNTSKKPTPTRRGVIDVTRSGKGFFITPDDAKDIPVLRDALGRALSGDIVEVTLHKGQRETVARVVKVIERKRTSFVGEVIRTDKGLDLRPDDSRVYTNFMIVGGVGTPAGQKVIADVVNWDTELPSVTVRRALGMSGNHETEMRAILAGRGFEPDFPADVLRDADAEVAKFNPEDIDGRRDFRDVLTFTIDPVDAKDFDDAISLKQIDGETIEVGIHIADVSHFVRPGSALDREATRRATSVYLVDRTIPMLPAQLSEELCSLKPNVTRYTYAAVFTFKGTKLVDRWFGRTVIHSKKRFTYEEADTTLETPDAPLHAELSKLWSIAQKLRSKRTDDGSIMFDNDELRPILNEKKQVTGFKRSVYTASHKLIEEFMLLANREVAGLVSKKLGTKSRVFLYRVHDVPNAERLEELAIFLRALGYQLSLTSAEATQRELNKMLTSIKGSAEESLIKTATVRTMTKAIYTTKNIGHFGLAFKDYANFTSPIRRYPDVTVHRTLTALLNDKPITATPYEMEQLAVHTSQREAEASDAERTSIKLKQVEYMEKFVGTERAGVVSGVTEWGIYIADNESGCEGMVRLMSMTDDTYEHNPKKFAVVGAKSKRVIQLGDPITFKVVNVDVKERLVDYALVAAA